METSTSRPYFAIFAVIAILIAGFILKQELTEGKADVAPGTVVDPNDPHIQVHETARVWFTRVGWQKLGYPSKEQADQTLALLETRRLRDLDPDQQKLVHELIAEKGPPHDAGIGLLPGIRNPDTEKKFLPDVVAQFDPAPDSQNSVFRSIMASWCGSPAGEEVVKTLENDKNPTIVKYVTNLIYNHDNPSSNVSGAG